MRQLVEWGVTGWSTEWTSLEPSNHTSDDRPTGFGFVRVVEPGVVYIEPPVAGAWIGWTESPASGQRRYQMPWSEDDVPQILTVLDLHARLQPRRTTLVKGDEHLRELDDCILEAVRLVDRLHRNGGTLGFVQPTSVLFCRLRDGSLRVVLPDVGFAWDDERGLREPRWIAEPPLPCFFEDGPRRANAACLMALKETVRSTERKPKAGNEASTNLGLAQQSDVRLLARLVAVALVGVEEVTRWCGHGRAVLSVPGRDRAPDTQAPVWDQVVAPALLGKLKTCADLVHGLERAPPSEHYLFRPPLPPPLWRRVMWRALPGLVGIGAIAVLVVLARPTVEQWLRPQPPHPLCAAVSASDPRFRQLNDLERMREAAQVGDMPSVAQYWTELQAAKQLPVPCLDKLFEEAAGWANDHALAIAERLYRQPLPRREQVKSLQTALDLLTSVEGAIPGRCERAIAVLLRQLEARGVPPHRRSAERIDGDPFQDGERPATDRPVRER